MAKVAENRESAESRGDPHKTHDRLTTHRWTLVTLTFTDGLWANFRTEWW